MNNTLRLSAHTLFTLHLSLAVLGAYLDYKDQHTSHYIWLTGMVLFSAIAIVPHYLQTPQPRRWSSVLSGPVWHWLGALLAVTIIYAYQNSGRLYHEEGDLVVLILLALTTYQQALSAKDWRGLFTGAFLALIAVCVAYFDSYIWQLTTLALAAIGLSFALRDTKPTS